ncbi:MAG: hypothetical protein FIB00_09910 [Chloroflexi bacterium]|nr:hypothetical protein [Chloroflexota bacterium]
MLDVTDTFDAFHRVAALLWREFGPVLAADEAGDEGGVGYDELVDQLELDLFLPACARLWQRATGKAVDSDEIAARIRLVSPAGAARPGAAGRYHSHAFHPDAVAAEVPNAVLAADLMSVLRADIRLVIGPAVAQPPRPQRRELPIR